MLNGNQVFWKKFKVIIEKVMRQFLKFVLKYFLSQNFSLPLAMINKMAKGINSKAVYWCKQH